MKKYITPIISIFVLLGLMACEENNDSTSTITKVDVSVIDDFPANEYILTNPGDDDPVVFTATWTETLFYLDNSSTPTPLAPVNYILQIDKANNDFESPYVLAKTTSLAMDVSTIELNTLLTDSLQAIPGQSIDIELRLLINYGKDETKYIVSTNTINLSVTPFEYRSPLKPVYIIGDMNGWNNTNTNDMLIMFKENSLLNNNVFSFTGYIPDNCSFRLLPQESLGTDAGYYFKEDGKLELREDAGTSLYNATAGFKTITVNLKNLTYMIEDYNMTGANTFNMLGFIGEFCGWSNEPLMTKLSTDNNHIWRLDYTLPAIDEDSTHPVKFRAERDWFKRWAAIDPNAVPYGRTIYLTGDEADPNIVVPEGGDYTIVFNDLTGHYIILKK